MICILIKVVQKGDYSLCCVKVFPIYLTEYLAVFFSVKKCCPREIVFNFKKYLDKIFYIEYQVIGGVI